MLVKLIGMQGLIALLGFLSTSVLTKTYGISAFGEIAFALAVANIFACVIRYGYDETLIVRLHKSTEAKTEFFSSLCIRYGLFILTAALLFVLPQSISRLSLDQVLVVVSFLLVVLQLQSIFDYVGKQILHVSTVVFNKLMIFTFLLALSFSFDALTNYMLAIFIANITVLFIQFILYQKIQPFSSSASYFTNLREVIIDQLKGNFTIMLASLLALSLYSANQIIIKEKLSFIELGVFAVQWQVVNVFVIFLKQLTRIYKPKLALYLNRSDSKFKGTYIQFACIVSFLPALAGIMLYPFYDFIFSTLFGDDLLGYKNIYLLMMLFLFLRGVHLSITQWFILFQINRPVMLSYLFSLLGASIITVVYWKNYVLADAVIAMIIGMGFAVGFLAINLLLKYFNKPNLSKIKDI